MSEAHTVGGCCRCHRAKADREISLSICRRRRKRCDTVCCKRIPLEAAAAATEPKTASGTEACTTSASASIGPTSSAPSRSSSPSSMASGFAAGHKTLSLLEQVTSSKSNPFPNLNRQHDAVVGAIWQVVDGSMKIVQVIIRTRTPMPWYMAHHMAIVFVTMYASCFIEAAHSTSMLASKN